MNIRQLHIFHTVCQQKSFTKAAELLDMTQPAVSHAVRQLEEEIGCPLFDRIGHHIYLTGAGEGFLERASEALAAFTKAQQFGKRADRSPLRLGSNITIAGGILPELMETFYQRFAEIPVRVRIDSAAQIRRALCENELDLALIEGEFADERLAKEVFCTYEMAVVCAPAHPLARRGKVSLEEFAASRLLLREKGSAIRDLLEGALLAHHIAIDPQWVSVNSQALIRAASRGLGLTALPASLLADQLARGELVRLELEGLKLVNRGYAVYLKEKYQSEGMRAFLQLIRAYARERGRV